MIEIVIASMLGWVMISKAMGNGSAMKEALKNSEKVYKSKVEHGDVLQKIKNSLEILQNEDKV